jgi:Zn-dependent protease
MRGSLPLLRFRGIQVLIHWSFLLLPAYVAYMGWSKGSTWKAIAADVGLVLIVFVCVLLHEFGHALTAQRYGVGTRDITLLPIGGIASLERMPEDPRQEFWITVAGPMVNLVIAGVAFLLLAVGGLTLLTTDIFSDLGSWTALLSFIFVTNISLFLFNLIPAYPMDGGRILRSVLGMRMERDKATRIATSVGRVMAVGFVAYGVYAGAPFLAIIGVFIFMAAGAEARTVQQRARLKTFKVHDVMRKDPLFVAPTATVQDAWNAITLVDHNALVVMESGTYRGIVVKEDLRRSLAEGKGTNAILPLVHQVPNCASTEAAIEVYRTMLSSGDPAMPVTEVGSIVGTIHRMDLERSLGAQVGPLTSTSQA